MVVTLATVYSPLLSKLSECRQAVNLLRASASLSEQKKKKPPLIAYECNALQMQKMKKKKNKGVRNNCIHYWQEFFAKHFFTSVSHPQQYAFGISYL